MKVYGVLLVKELREALRTGKLIWLPAVFVLLGLIQPISAKFMPDIIAAAGSLPEGAMIQIPIPKPGEVLGQTLSQFGTIGVLAICLAYMGTISGEKRNGTAAWILVKPVARLAYVASKWTALCLIVGFAFLLGYGGAWYYTNLLIGVADAATVAVSGFLYFAWLVFVGTVTIAASAWIRSPAGAAFSAFGFAIVLQIVRGLFENRLSWLPSGLNNAAIAGLAAGETPSWAVAASVTAVCVMALITIAVKGANAARL
ncbi:ABC transporter permease [Cohnella terricola]|uniref:ABC transporter permease subunit n=1 Tax=Cohnella terricola TaxID=1289167 RepID=A0A559J6E6_9BACL|nr:ABC transporter permease subunit [Cohnella terricola]TVX95455.1 ABC transporter permease subunit [Cohnella terricola]